MNGGSSPRDTTGRRARIAATFLGLVTASLTSACLPDFDPPWRVVGTRVLAARASVDGDEARATPSPGERVRVELMVVHPREAIPVAWSFLACEPAPASVGPAGCRGEPLGVSERLDPSVDAPTLSFDVPATYGSRAILVAGVLCAGGVALPVRHLDARGCAPGASKSELVRLTVPIADDIAAANHHPEFGDEPLEVRSGAQVLPTVDADPALLEGCVDRAPVVRAAEHPTPTLHLRAPTRETYVADGIAREETLDLATVIDAGELERHRTVLEPGRDEADLTLRWPGSLVERGTFVRVQVVARDDRGGTSWIARAVCVVP